MDIFACSLCTELQYIAEEYICVPSSELPLCHSHVGLLNASSVDYQGQEIWGQYEYWFSNFNKCTIVT